jgi:hypothetical protein
MRDFSSAAACCNQCKAADVQQPFFLLYIAQAASHNKSLSVMAAFCCLRLRCQLF